jgi:hypothetical protein
MRKTINVVTAIEMAIQSLQEFAGVEVKRYDFMSVSFQHGMVVRFVFENQEAELFQVIMHDNTYFSVKPYDDCNKYKDIMIVGNTNRKAHTFKF